MRPATIVNFERLMFASLAIGIAQAAIGWDGISDAAAGRSGNALLSIIGAWAAVILITTTVTLFVSRRRSRIAMWIGILLCLIGLLSVARDIRNDVLIGTGWLILAQTGAQVVAYVLLFTPSARSWMNWEDEDEDYPEDNDG